MEQHGMAQEAPRDATAEDQTEMGPNAAREGVVCLSVMQCAVIGFAMCRGAKKRKIDPSASIVAERSAVLVCLIV